MAEICPLYVIFMQKYLLICTEFCAARYFLTICLDDSLLNMPVYWLAIEEVLTNPISAKEWWQMSHIKQNPQHKAISNSSERGTALKAFQKVNNGSHISVA